jgi:hypothetical protein
MDTARARRLLDNTEALSVPVTFTVKTVKVPVVVALLGAGRPSLGIKRTPPVGDNLVGVGGVGLAAFGFFKAMKLVAVVAVEPGDIVARSTRAPARIIHRSPPVMMVAISPGFAAGVLAALYFLETVELFASVVLAKHTSNVVAVVARTHASSVER